MFHSPASTVAVPVTDLPILTLPTTQSRVWCSRSAKKTPGKCSAMRSELPKTPLGNGRPQIRGRSDALGARGSARQESKLLRWSSRVPRPEHLAPRPARIGQHRVGTPRSLPGCGDP
jgi:hypothetical protein